MAKVSSNVGGGCHRRLEALCGDLHLLVLHNVQCMLALADSGAEYTLIMVTLKSFRGSFPQLMGMEDG